MAVLTDLVKASAPSLNPLSAWPARRLRTEERPPPLCLCFCRRGRPTRPVTVAAVSAVG